MSRLAIALIFLVAVARAQVTGRITGTVVDPSGASIPIAKINVFLAGGTSPVAETATGREGLFSIETIRPEFYDILIQASGFQDSRLRGVKVDPSRSTDLGNLKLEIANAATSIEVSALAESVQVTTNDLSTTVTMDQLRRLPVGDRSVVSFISTQAGVAPSWVGTNINGQRPSFTTMTLDGVNIQDNYIRDNALDFTPNLLLLDQVQDFTVTTSNAGAGASGASGVSMSTPSGGNVLHGNVYYQNRNNIFAANSWFGNKDGNPLPSLNLNQFGASVGGPISKDKLFYYMNYEMYRSREDTTIDTTILTADARQGIFTWQDSRTGQVQKKNILNIVGLDFDPLMTQDIAKTPSPDKINNYRLGDSQPGLLRNTAGYSFLAKNDWNRDHVTSRLDYNLTPRHQFASSFLWNREFSFRPDSGTAFFTEPPVRNDQAAKFLSLSWRWTPSPNFTNEVRGGFNFAPGYFLTNEKIPDYYIGGQVYTSPVVGYLPQGRETHTYSVQDNATWIQGRHTLKFGYQMQGIRVRSFDFSGTVPTYYVGTTSFSQQSLLLFQPDLPGVSTSDLARANDLLATLTGLLDSAFATYNVTSRASGFVPGAGYERNLRMNNHAFYMNEEWKAHRHLTVNAGMRWDYYLPVDERDSLLIQPLLQHGDARYTMLQNSTLFYAGNSLQRPLYLKDKNNFGPSIGVAWDVFGNGKTSVRAGYGVYFANDQNILVAETFPYFNPGLQGYRAEYDLEGTLSRDRPVITAPQFRVPQTFSDAYANDSGASFALIDPKLRTPYVQEFNFAIQQEFKGTIFEVRYVGNHATKLLRAFDYNQTDIRSNGFLDDFLRAQNNGNLYRNLTGKFDPAYRANVPGSQPLTVFPRLSSGGFLTNATVQSLIDQGQPAELAYIYQVNQLNGSLNFFPNPYALSSIYLTNFSNASYHSLQVEVRRRFRKGLEFQGNYTFSKNLSDTAGTSQIRYSPFQDINNAKIDKSRTPFDLTHQFKANYVYELPLSSRRRWANRLLSGWSTSGNVLWVSGNPFSVYSGRGTFLRSNLSNVNEANTALNLEQLKSALQFRMTGDGPYVAPASAIFQDGRAVAPDGQAAFNGQLFFNPTAGNIGTLQRRMFTGPSVFNMDASVRKMIRFHERFSAQLGLDALNVFNTPTFLVDSQDINSTQFGKVTSAATSPRRLQLSARFTF